MVLFPGLLLPLHIFEDRYRTMIQDLLALPQEQRRIAIVAIRSGREVGADGVTAMHEVGCVAWLRRVEEHDDGRYDIVTTGAERFTLAGLRHDRPYLVGDVELLEEELGDPDRAVLMDGAVRTAYGDYLSELGRAGGEALDEPELPQDPTVLSYLVAATVMVDLDVRQSLLAQPDATSRLTAELALLRRETQLLRVLTSAPSPSLTRGPISPN